MAHGADDVALRLVDVTGHHRLHCPVRPVLIFTDRISTGFLVRTFRGWLSLPRGLNGLLLEVSNAVILLLGR